MRTTHAAAVIPAQAGIHVSVPSISSSQCTGGFQTRPYRRFLVLHFLTLLFLSAPVFASLSDGLVAWYPLNGDAIDYSGGGHHGAITAAIPDTDRFGNPNGCFLFDGLYSRIVIGDFELVTGDQLTIQSWFRTDAPLPYARPLVSKLFNDVAYYLGANAAGDNKLQFRTVNATTTVSDNPVNDGQWHHAVGVYDGQWVRLYIDGQIQSAVTEGHGYINNIDEPLCIGTTTDSPEPTETDRFAGNIDDVRIWNRALGQTEVQELFELPEKYSGGSGTSDDPYQIATPADLIALGNTPTDYGKHFILMADIDLAGQTFTKAVIAPDLSFADGFQGTPFTGTFDGNSHAIHNTTIHQTERVVIGLFGFVGDGGLINNLGLESVHIGGGDYVGGIAGENSGTIRACYATGDITSNYVGGLIGVNLGSITSCYSAVSVGGSSIAGGLVGENEDGMITFCFASGAVNSGSDAGGLVGWNETKSTIASCYATGSVMSGRFIGGLVGGNHGTISTCYSIGAVAIGTEHSGGMVGLDANWYGKPQNCFWDMETSGQTESEGGTGKTTAEMKQLSTFTDAGWDFATVWMICDGESYPHLQWEKYQCHLAEIMVSIPAGTFQMGDSIGDGYSEELPVHTVTLNSFAMGKYLVTNEQYSTFLKSAYPSQLKVVNGVVYASGDTANSFAYCDTSISSSYSQIAFSNNTFSIRTKGGRDMTNDPMVMVSWYGGVAYCNWRSQQESKQVCYNLSTWNCDFSKKGYRLATEAEWEYAARGGLFGKRFPWGDMITHSQANYYSYWEEGKPYNPYDLNPTEGFHPTWNDGIEPYTSPASSFPANGYGLYDMAGNVLEWCQDWYGNYSSSSQTNPTGPATGSLRVARGGCWYDYGGAIGCRVSSRHRGNPIGSQGVGFRVVLDIAAATPYSGGTGTEEDPYQIRTAADLIALGNTPADYDKHFIVFSLDLSGRTFDRAVIAPDIDDALDGFQGPAFTGHFIGGDAAIRNLTIRTDPVKRDFLALFGKIGPDAIVEDLGLVDVSVSGLNNSTRIAAFCGENEGTISNGYVAGAVHGGDASSCVGGLCGSNLIGGRILYGSSYVAVTAGNNSRSVGGLCGLNQGTIEGSSAFGPVNCNDGSHNFGCLCGSNEAGILSHCTASGPVTGGNNTASIGGLCGDNQTDAVITACSATGAVTGNAGSANAGGISGANQGSITDCTVSGTVSGGNYSVAIGGLCGLNSGAGSIRNGSTSGYVYGGTYVGGLVGRNDGASIVNSFATRLAGGGACVGGLTGWNSGTIAACYATASAEGIDSVGGLSGYNLGTISDCYATGTTTASGHYVGGLVGWNDWGTITRGYSTGFVSGNLDAGGLVGFEYSGSVSGFWNLQTSNQPTSDGGTGLTSAEMKTLAIYAAAGWDFASTWIICDGLDYPHLQWESYDCQNIPRYAGGSGDWEDPYQIRTPENLQSLALHPDDWDKHFVLVADIDLSGLPNLQIGRYGPEGDPDRLPFTGTFVCCYGGDTYSIGNYRYTTSESAASVGLFGYLAGGVIVSMTLDGVDIEAPNSSFVGGIVGVIEGGGIDVCQVHGRIVGKDVVGGIVGLNWQATVSGCRIVGEVHGQQSIGGIVGYSYGGSTILDCLFQGVVTGNSTTGGIAGGNDELSQIKRCYSTGIVNGDSFVGGIAGVNYYSTIEDSGSLCDEIGESFLGGLVGVSDYGASVARSYSAGVVSGGQPCGGLIGFGNGNATNSFWDIQTSGQPTSVGGQGKSTAEMKSQSFFLAAGWDFEDEDANGDQEIWMMRDGLSYPRLTTMFTFGSDTIGDYGTNFEEFSAIADHWLVADCVPANHYCSGGDRNHDRRVDLADVLLLAEYWMSGQ